MDQLDAMLGANEVLGDENNIFGGNKTAIDAMVEIQQKSGTNIIDYKKYNSVPETQKIDYDKLTQVSDKDVYKVVSVQETVIKDDDGSGQNVTKQTINYQPDGDTTDTNKLKVAQENTQTANTNSYNVDSDNEADGINKLKIIIENDDTLNLSGIDGKTTIQTIKSLSAKLKTCIFYDEDGYEISNKNTKIEAVADIDGDKFVLNAKIKIKTITTNPTDDVKYK